MRPLRRRIATVVAAGAAVLAGSLSPLLVSSPASADVTGSTSSGDVVLYPSCQSHLAQYQIQVSPGTYFWNLQISAVSPAGLRSAIVTLTSNKSTLSGTVQAGYFCGSEAVGTWTVHGEGIYEFFPGAQQSYTLPDSTFTVRQAMTRTTVSFKKLRHHRVRLISSVTDERRAGYGRTEGARVEFEQLVDGQWQKVRRSRERTLHGHTTHVIRLHRGATYRAVTYGLGNYAGSTSAPTTVR